MALSTASRCSDVPRLRDGSIRRILRGEVLIHEIVRWQTNGKNAPVLVWTACGIAADGPSPFRQARSGEPATCLWCVVNQRGTGLGVRQTWVP